MWINTVRLGAEAQHLVAGLQLDGVRFELFVGTADVRGFYPLVVFADKGSCGLGFGQAVGLGRNDSVADKLFYPARIAEVGRALLEGLLDGGCQFCARFIGEQVFVLGEDVLSNLQELCGVIVVEVKLIGESVLKTWVHRHQTVHFCFVTGKDDEHVRVFLAERGEQTLYGATSKVIAALAAVKSVGLINEEHVAASLLEQVLNVILGIADEPSDEPATVNGDNLALGEQTQMVVDSAEHLGYCGLTGARITCEDGMEHFLAAGGQSLLAPLGIDSDLMGYGDDALLDVLEPYHLLRS